MRLLLILATGLALLASPLRAGTTTVAVDPAFAPVAAALTDLFAEQTGHALELSVEAPGALPQTRADVLLATDAETPKQLAATGRAEGATVMTYAMGLTGTEAAAKPRDAVLLSQGADNPVALAFLDFLMTSEAWDVIVSHGYGAH